MTPETKHLLKWWFEWLKRLIYTSYHLLNRKAYRTWKRRRVSCSRLSIPEIDAMDESDLH